MKNFFTNVYFMSFMPVILIHAIFFPFWQLGNNSNLGINITIITLIELLVNLVIVPVYLLAINYLIAIKGKVKLFILNIFIITLASFLGNFLHFLNWGITTKNLSNVDWESKILLITVSYVNLITIIAFGIILQIVIIIKHKKEKI